MDKIRFLLCLFAGLQVNGQERWQNEYDHVLSFACPSLSSISKIVSKHDNHHEDRIWDFSCKDTFESSPQCFWSPYANYFDEYLSYSCPDNYVMSGMESYHENKHEDRRWKFYCCRDYKYCNSHCQWTPHVNNFDEEFTWYVPHMNYLVGVSSYHENKHEDRRWQYMYCSRQPC
ncbi:hemagglutinin/amebocyte aggregation factor-like [Megalops cyprinoides]|uniref:hemagglutinin/amebocyte aggregation factor-like n=1 Tax=Megalops cyprinoides TaxID=118141 RepID=UPI001864D489|nr:hemagglutinin/amebocyte aggregation factor-like [Megalops cyprinoides]